MMGHAGGMPQGGMPGGINPAGCRRGCHWAAAATTLGWRGRRAGGRCVSGSPLFPLPSSTSLPTYLPSPPSRHPTLLLPALSVPPPALLPPLPCCWHCVTRLREAHSSLVPVPVCFCSCPQASSPLPLVPVPVCFCSCPQASSHASSGTSLGKWGEYCGWVTLCLVFGDTPKQRCTGLYRNVSNMSLY